MFFFMSSHVTSFPAVIHRSLKKRGRGRTEEGERGRGGPGNVIDGGVVRGTWRERGTGPIGVRDAEEE